MECQAPTLGHSALRCAGLSRSQARLQMLPATLYLLGFLFIIFVWIKFAIARRIFLFRQVASLSFCGCLDFVLATVAVHHPQSIVLGGLSSLVFLSQLFAVCTFLPPHETLPGNVDRMVAAFFTSSLILNILASIRINSTSRDANDIVIAEAVCLLCFYLTCVCASQFSRLFAVVDRESGSLRLAPTMSPLVTATYLLSLILFIAQTCIAFAIPRTFGPIMVASMASALGFLLLVATFVLLHRPEGGRDWDEPKADAATLNGNEETLVKEEAREEANGQVPSVSKSNSQVVFSAVPTGNRRSRLASNLTNLLDSERGSVVFAGSKLSTGHTDQLGGNRQSSRAQSGLSLTSWGRLEQLMNRGASGSRDRAASGVTYYGSESSYPEGAKTVRSSIFSSFGLSAIGHGHNSATAPPVPSIDPTHLGFAKPLTIGEAPIRLQKRSASSLSPSSRNETPQRGIKGAFSVISSLFNTPDRSAREELVRDSQSMTTLVPTQSQDSPNGLPARYQSNKKLFPATEWETEEDSVVVLPKPSLLSQEVISPNESDFRHTQHHGTSSLQSSPTFDVKHGGFNSEHYNASSENISAYQSLPSPSRSKKTKVLHRESVAEDPKTSMTTSIMFPRY